VTSIDPSLAPLTRALRAIRGEFSLHFICCPLGSRTALVHELAKVRALDGVPLFLFNDPSDHAPTVIERLLDGTRALDGLVIINGDVLLTDDATPLLALNLARDRLRSLCHGPLVIVSTDDALTSIAKLAPDLYSVCSTVTHFNRETPVRLEAPPVAPPVSTLEALRALLALVEHKATNANPEVLADTGLEVARRAYNGLLGADERERQALRELATSALQRCDAIAREIGYERAWLDAEVLTVSLSPTRRESDEATLRSVIARFAQLGAAQSEAIAWATLSAVLEPSAPDEAHRAIVEHALPLYARAGLHHALASLLLQFAENARTRKGPRAALELLDHWWNQCGPQFSPMDRASISWLRSSLSQFVGDVDRAIVIAQEARESATRAAASNALAAALLREIIARAERRTSVDRSVVAQLLPQYRAEAARSPAFDASSAEPSLRAALVRLDLVAPTEASGRKPNREARRQQRRR
jgi:hypothetical protein